MDTELATIDWSRYLRTGAAARRAGYSVQWLQYLVRHGRLSPIQTPWGWAFDVRDMDRLRDERVARAAEREKVAV